MILSTRLATILTIALVAACTSSEPPAATEAESELSQPTATPVWMDVDVAVMRGGHEPDDGLALVQAFNSPELRVVGVSSVFGNAPLERGFPLAKEIAAKYGPEGLGVHRGAASSEELGNESDATHALAEALRQQKLTVLALGPVTNVASLLKLQPQLAGQIEAIVAVAGRRPGHTFTLGDGGVPLMDLNFDLDPEGFQILLDSGVPIVLAPFEISAKVPLYETEDIARFKDTRFGEYFFEPIQDYVQWYDDRFNLRAIFPYDTLAVGYVLTPESMECESLPIEIQTHPDDVNPGKDKPYLIVSSELEDAQSALYCHTAHQGFKEDLIRRLLAS